MTAPLTTPEALEALHRRCFTTPRPWSADEFASLIASSGVFLLTRPQGGLQGFLLGRVVADEAELLTLATAPEARRQGLGRDLTREFAATSQAAGARTGFLEVAADNLAAQALYAGLGWCEAGRRRRYYGPELDAVVMRLDLPDPEQGS